MGSLPTVVAPDEVEVVREYHREHPDGAIEAVKIMLVPESEKFPEGVKYRLHYGTYEGETLLRYDNSHGVHERHTGDGNVTELPFPGIAQLYERFIEETEEL